MRLALFVCILALSCAYAQEATPEYSMVDIYVPPSEFTEFLQLGLAIDECDILPGSWYRVAVNARELQELKKSHFSYRMVIEDVEKYYASRYTQEDIKAAETYRATLDTQMKLGSMGGFYTWEEVLKNMDDLYQSYGGRNLITQKVSIGKSFEGRDIYAIKISDNASTDESDREPQVLYTALTHAREPAGMMTLFYFMYYLLENYDKDTRVQSIVDNRELYFVPVVNPDGYYYNQKSSPTGGGMRRKNCNGSGIDLNRNFGPQELWDYPNGGSSTSSWSETYRGTAPFSEPETAALSNFVRTKKFRTAINYHTYSNLLLYPWGYKDAVAHPTFPIMAKDMVKISGYRYGTPPGLLYAVRGDSDSWFFQEAKVFAVTIETGSGSDGFWPKSTRIFPLAEENKESNMIIAEYADKVK